jgi:hypothetical protein
MKNIKLKIVYIIICLAASIALVEGVSSVILKKINLNSANKLKFNRELSGYMVFKNTPGFTYGTIKDDPSEKDLKTNDYGLICDEPLTFEKPPGVVRIFLMGGSAMIGSGQNSNYTAIKKFPQGTYAYAISIAGYLKKYLSQKYPGKKIEVINAACYGWQLHQSMIYYLETVSLYKPDIVIDMDGYNDVLSFCTGNIFDLTEFIKLKSFVDLKVQTEKPVNRFKSVQLVSYLFAKKNKLEVVPKSNYFVDTSAYNQARYRQLKSQLQNSSTTFLRILNQYMNVLKGDSVHFAFILQPILDREINKPFTEVEQRMRREVGTQDVNDRPDFYDDPRFDLKKSLLALDSIKGIGHLVRRYFFDDWLSDRFRKDVEARDFAYLDMNHEISGLDKNFEFYTDYCHMTKEGNKFVAEKIGAMIVEKNFIP